MRIYNIIMMSKEYDFQGRDVLGYRFRISEREMFQNAKFVRGKMRAYHDKYDYWFTTMDEHGYLEPPEVVWLPLYKKRDFRYVMPGEGVVRVRGTLRWTSRDYTFLECPSGEIKIPDMAIVDTTGKPGESITVDIDYWYAAQAGLLDDNYTNSQVEVIWNNDSKKKSLSLLSYSPGGAMEDRKGEGCT